MSAVVQQADIDAADKWLSDRDAFSPVHCRDDLAQAFADRVAQAPDYKSAWEALYEPLMWMQNNKQLGGYIGWNLAEIANDLIDRAYPTLRAGKEKQ